MRNGGGGYQAAGKAFALRHAWAHQKMCQSWRYGGNQSPSPHRKNPLVRNVRKGGRVHLWIDWEHGRKAVSQSKPTQSVGMLAQPRRSRRWLWSGYLSTRWVWEYLRAKLYSNLCLFPSGPSLVFLWCLRIVMLSVAALEPTSIIQSFMYSIQIDSYSYK